MRALVFMCVLHFASPSLADRAQELLEQPAPDFALKSLSGQNLRLSEYRGEIVLVNFWASWCGPCRQQLDVLDELHAQFSDQGLIILSVSIDRKSKRSAKFLAQLKPPFPVLRDERKSVSRLYDIDDMPLTLFIDQTGTVRAVHEGFSKDDTDLYQSQLTALMAE